MKTDVTLNNCVLEFTPARRFRDALAEGQAAGTMRLTGLTVIDGQRLNLSVRFAAPTDGAAILSPVYDDGGPVVRTITLRNPEGDIDCVRLTADGAPEETLTGPDGEAVPATSTCCWVAFGIGSATLAVDNISEPRVRESGLYADADIAGEITFARPIDPFGGRVAGLGGAAVRPPTAKMVAAAALRRATRAAAAAAAQDVAF